MNEKNIFIVRAGEAALKGENKPYFERMLVERIKKLLKRFDGVEVTRKEGLIFVHADKSIPPEDIIKWVSKAFGVQTISPAVEVESDIEAIGRAAVEYMNGIIAERDIKTFKVKAKRADKQFPVESPDIARQVGAMILKGCKVLKVDVHDPDCYLYVNVRKGISYIYQDKIEGFGGLPLGTNGKGLVLLSGGIDSPVAAFMMAKRGMAIETIHFHSYPYTSERAREKVEDLASQLAVYCSRFKMHIVNLLPIQEEIVRHCPEEETTIHVRMFMMRIAEKIAEKNGCTMLVTGESLGQVASQTAEALVVTNSAVSMPVMRPLIALDKTEIIAIAQEIETFETSIEPYEDCCTVFLPKHPLTKPKTERILKSESTLDIDDLVEKAVDSEEIVDIFPKK
ncbi:MAG: tRNA 4-thiouridine(8) synthase ThiI [Eubacteriaceae bacterium]|jgi:thiamine biosynthesis protein ThiI|nr:tRNA 4-thiouridine(8) synthase ThiI [Eubacteriaceae bacterium]